MSLPTKPSSTEPAPVTRARRLDAMVAGLAAVALPLAGIVAQRLGLPAFSHSLMGLAGIGLLIQLLVGGNHVRWVRERLVQRRLKGYPSSGPISPCIART